MEEVSNSLERQRMEWAGKAEYSKMMLEELKETGGSAADIAQVQEAYNTSIREWIEVVKKQSELWAIPPQGKKLQELDGVFFSSASGNSQ